MPGPYRDEGNREPNGRTIPSEAERARGTLWIALLVLRWGWYIWLVGLAISTRDRFDMELLAWISVIATGLWTAWLTIPGHQQRPETRWIDLTWCVWLVLASALVVPEGEIADGPVFAVSYPASAALLWGMARGPLGGLFAGVVLSVALALGRPLNGLTLADPDNVLDFGDGVVGFIAAGLATGIYSALFSRWALQFRSLMEAATRARERAARLAEHRALARRIHDSVLNSLALVSKRGRDLARQERVSSGEVRQLAELAGEQEAALRSLILREPEEAPEGTISLRDALNTTSREGRVVPVTVSCVGQIWLPAGHVEQILEAVGQALDNVDRHSGGTRAAIFADAEDGWVIVSVRDNGRGFVYDEQRLKSENRAGMIKSMKGRIEELGGRMRVETAPGIGTEVEFRVPRSTEEESAPARDRSN